MGTMTLCLCVCLFTGACLLARDASGRVPRVVTVAVLSSFGVALIRTVMMAVEKDGW